MFTKARILIILILLSLSHAHAKSMIETNSSLKFQESTLSETFENIRYGITGGGTYFLINNTSSYSQSDERISKNYDTGLTIGLMSEFKINEYLFFQTELSFVQVNSNFEYQNEGPGGVYDADGNPYNDVYYYDDEIELNILEFPLLAKIKWPLNDTFQPYLKAGPQIGFLLSSNKKQHWKWMAESDFSNVFHESTSEEDISNNFKSFNAGINIGVGFNINFFNIYTRYQLGLTDQSNNTPKSNANGLFYGISIFL